MDGSHPRPPLSHACQAPPFFAEVEEREQIAPNAPRQPANRMGEGPEIMQLATCHRTPKRRTPKAESFMKTHKADEMNGKDDKTSKTP